MQILVATLRGAVHQQQRAAAYAALLPSLLHRLKYGAFFTGIALFCQKLYVSAAYPSS